MVAARGSVGIGDVTTFPPDPPRDLDDPAIIRAHDWHAFRQLSRMESHWDRPGWKAGRRSYHWILSFHDANDVQDLAKQCQTQLPPSDLDLVPPDALHVTVGRIGFTDELTRAVADATGRAAIPRCQELAPLALAIGPLAGSGGAIRFSITPWAPLLTLHSQLGAATQAVIGQRSVMHTSQFRPHLSIAYANTTVPIASLRPALDRLRLLPPVSVTVPSVVLVELRREDRAYRYEVVAEVPLADG